MATSPRVNSAEPQPQQPHQPLKEIKQEIERYQEETFETFGGCGGGGGQVSPLEKNSEYSDREHFCSAIIQNLIDGAGGRQMSSSTSGSNNSTSPQNMDVEEHHHHHQQQQQQQRQQQQDFRQQQNMQQQQQPHYRERCLQDEFKLEYMDLHDFMMENELPIEDDELMEQLANSGQSQQRMQQHQFIGGGGQQRTSPATSSPHIPVQLVPPQPTSSSASNSPFSMNTSGKSSQQQPHHVQQQQHQQHQLHHHHSMEGSPGAHPLPGGCSSGRFPGSYDDEMKMRATVTSSSSSTNGGDLMAPHSMRKRPKRMVSDENKDAKYWERRRKNNLAAKRSRDLRRIKENQIAYRATLLEKDNRNLSSELNKARAENELLRQRLSKYESI